jgi:MFS family permease
VLSALKHRNFRLFFFGQGISLIGTWMQQVAMIWLVYRLSDSEFLLGLVGFCSLGPSFLLAPVAGVFSDRWNLHRTIIATQTLAMLQAAALVALTLGGVIAVWHILLLSVLLGLVNAFDVPARQAFLVQMVEGRQSLPSAIGLNSSMFNGARLVGPAIAGLLIDAAGEWLCFFVNAVSYVAVLVALLAMRVTPPARARPPQRVLHELREGLVYAFGSPAIRALLLLLAVVSLAAMPLSVLMPVFAKEVLHGGPGTLGMLTAAMGLGALGGALVLAARKSVLGLGRLIAWASSVVGLGLFGFALSGELWLSLVLLAITGFAMMMGMAASNTILQTIVEDDKRGRVMSLYTMAFLGTAPLGSLLAGFLASHVGAVPTVQAAGAVCLAGSLVFARRLPALRRVVHPIYQRIGVLPEATSAVPPPPEWTAASEE